MVKSYAGNSCPPIEANAGLPETTATFFPRSPAEMASKGLSVSKLPGPIPMTRTGKIIVTMWSFMAVNDGASMKQQLLFKFLGSVTTRKPVMVANVVAKSSMASLNRSVYAIRPPLGGQSLAAA